jgi:hypothetical protein
MGMGSKGSRSSCSDTFLNLITIGVLLVTVMIGGIFVAIYLNPHLPLNPFPPRQANESPATAQSTATTIVALPPTWTATIEPTSTGTPEPTTPPPTNTLPVVSPLPTALPYNLQEGTPAYTKNFLNDLGCQWMGIAGQVFAFEDQPAIDVWIHLGGQLSGKPLDLLGLPGSAPGYGEGGYEFKLSDGPVASENLVWIELIDPAGNPLSSRVYLTTKESCEENLILVNWTRSE